MKMVTQTWSILNSAKKQWLKSQKLVISSLSLITMALNLHAQDVCKVELLSIATSYSGECKKGLANGTGTAKGTDSYSGEFKMGLPSGKGKYTWANGNVFEGEWKKGKKDGEGKMAFKTSSGQDSVVVGFWNDDNYIGKFKEAYKVFSYSSEVTNVKIAQEKKPTPEQFIEITILNKGQTVGTPSISIETLTGSYNQTKMQNRSVKIYIVQFPFRGNLSYNGHTVDFALNNPGAYNMTISINPIGN